MAGAPNPALASANFVSWDTFAVAASKIPKCASLLERLAFVLSFGRSNLCRTSSELFAVSLEAFSAARSFGTTRVQITIE